MPDYWRVRDPDDELPEQKEVLTLEEIMESFDKRESERRGDNVVIEVLKENEATVNVFRFCCFDFNGNISASEIHSVLLLFCVPKKKWSDVLMGIHDHMVPTVQKYLKSKTPKK